MADEHRIGNTYSQIEQAIAAVLRRTTGTNPSSEVTGLSGTESIPITLPGGQVVFIQYANFLADVMQELAVMDAIAEQARDAVGTALQSGIEAGAGLSVTPNDADNKIKLEVTVIDGGTY